MRSPIWSARLAAGAFLLVAAHPALGDRIWFAAARSDAGCPASGPPIGIAVLSTAGGVGSEQCLSRVTLKDLSDATLDEADQEMARLGNSPAVDFELDVRSCLPPAMTAEARLLRIPYAFKRLSSTARGAVADRTVLVSLASAEDVAASDVE